MPDPLLSIEDLTAAYGEAVALHEVTLTVGSGEAVSLIGANGAGKSTLLRSIIGLVRQRSGSIRFDGRTLDGLRASARARLGLGYCPEGREIFPTMSVRENLEVASWRDGAVRARLIEGVYDIFPQLAEKDRLPGWQLSGGQQQMLAIGRSLMGEPKLLLLDEPSLGLSPLMVSEVFRIIARIVREGTAVLLAEQNASKALRIGHRAYVLALGRVVIEGPASELRTDENVRSAYLGG